jgi:hypothetical protein
MPYDCGWTCSGIGEAPCRPAEGAAGRGHGRLRSAVRRRGLKEIPAAINVASATSFGPSFIRRSAPSSCDSLSSSSFFGLRSSSRMTLESAMCFPP